jgi:hypothetical protein
MRRVVILAVLGIISAAHSFAAQGGAEPGFFNGNFLYEACITDPRAAGPAGLSLCQGYVAAIADFADFMGILCAPKGTSVRQITDIVTRALKEMPEVRHQPAILLTLIALQLSYPCPHDHPVRQLGPN